MGSSGHGAQESGPRPANVQGRARVRSRLGQGLAAALGGLSEPQAGHYRLARSAVRDAGEPAAERPVETPETDRPAEPAEKTERPAKPAEKEAKPGQQPAAKEEKPSEKPRKGFLRRHPVLAPVGLIALLLAAAAGYLYWDHTSHFESTDDAFIAARQFAIAPKVAGYVTAVPVTDNQHVNKGDVIAQIDQRDYLHGARASPGSGGGGGSRHPQRRHADRHPRRADLRDPGAGGPGAGEHGARAGHLGTRPAARQARVGRRLSRARPTSRISRPSKPRVDSAQAALKVAQRQIDTLRAQRASAEASLAQAQAQLDQAKLNLSYTTVTADQPGRVVNLSGAVGQYAQAGTNLTMFVPDEIWVVANYKETQLDRMRPGQPVDLEIDAYPERALPRPSRQRPARLRPGLLAAAARKRHRQLRQDRPARAGQADPGQSADRRLARPGNVGRPDSARRPEAYAL